MLAETQTQVLPSAPGSALSFANLATVVVDDRRRLQRHQRADLLSRGAGQRQPQIRLVVRPALPATSELGCAPWFASEGGEASGSAWIAPNSLRAALCRVGRV